jgi:hypothetical protein
MRPMPIPAENIIATQEIVLNSGCSSSRPRVMLPKRLSASHSTKTTKPLDVTTNSQPVLAIVQDNDLSETSAREDVLTNPQMRKRSAIAAVTPKTTLSRPACLRRSWIGASSAGWGRGMTRCIFTSPTVSAMGTRNQPEIV